MSESVQKVSAGVVAAHGDLAVETEAAKAALELERLVHQTEVAARDWGVRPDHLEGRFISALLSTLTWLGRLIQAAAADLKAAAKENRTAAAADLEALRKASATAVKLQEQAQTALAVADVQVSKVVTRFVDSVSPQIVKHISEAVVLRERRRNQDALWGRAAGIAPSGQSGWCWAAISGLSGCLTPWLPRVWGRWSGSGSAKQPRSRMPAQANSSAPSNRCCRQRRRKPRASARPTRPFGPVGPVGLVQRAAGLSGVGHSSVFPQSAPFAPRRCSIGRG